MIDPAFWRTIERMAKMKVVTNAVIQRMALRIARRFKPERIILFGSRARGDANADSDVDLLVVMPVQGSKRAKRLEIGLELFNYRVSVDVVVVTPREFETDARIPGTIVRPAIHEGKVLYVRG
jgi:predicted nucleotidyltransferase